MRMRGYGQYTGVNCALTPPPRARADLPPGCAASSTHHPLTAAEAADGSSKVAPLLAFIAEHRSWSWAGMTPFLVRHLRCRGVYAYVLFAALTQRCAPQFSPNGALQTPWGNGSWGLAGADGACPYPSLSLHRLRRCCMLMQTRRAAQGCSWSLRARTSCWSSSQTTGCLSVRTLLQTTHCTTRLLCVACSRRDTPPGRAGMFVATRCADGDLVMGRVADVKKDGAV